MAEVASAYVALLPSFKGGASAISRELGGPLDTAGRDGGRRFGGGMRAGIAGVASSVFAPLAAAAAGVSLVGWAKGAIDEASGLGESVNALNVVFGDASGGIQELGKAASGALGLSNLDFNNLSVQFSSFVKTVAGPGGDVTKTLGDLTTRAADFASVMNLDVADAAALFQSGLAGETEPLRRYGIDLSAATVEAYAYANGIAAQGSQLTQAQKVQAAYGSLMAQTAQTQGDFANTSNSLANQQRILGASWDNLSGKIGTLFLPVVTAVVSFLTTQVVPAITGVVDTFTAAGGGMDGVVAVWQQATAGLGAWLAGGGMQSILDGLMAGRERMVELVLTLVPQMVDTLAASLPEMVTWVTSTAVPLLVTAVSQIAGTITQIVPVLVSALATAAPLLLAAAVDVLGALIQAAGAVLPDVIGAIVGMLPALVSALLGMLPDLLSAALDLFASIVDALVVVVPQVLTAMVDALPEIVSTLLGMLPGLIDAAADLFLGLVQGLVQALPDLLAALLSALPEIVSTLLGMLPTIVLAALDLFLGLVIGLVEALPPLLDTLITVVLPGLLTTIVGMVPQLIEAAITLFAGLVSALVEFTPDLLVMLIELIPQIVAALVSGVGQLIGAGWDLLTGLWDGLVQAWPSILDWTKTLPGMILSGLGNVGTILLDAGRAIIDGLWNGLRDSWENVTGWVSGLGEWIADNKGPKAVDLELLRPAGGWIMEGLQRGLRDELPALRATLGDVTSAITVGGAGMSASLSASNSSLTGLELTGTLDTPWGPATVRGIVRDEIASAQASRVSAVAQGVRR